MISQTQQKRTIVRIGIHSVLVLLFMILALIFFSIMQGCGKARAATRPMRQSIGSMPVAFARAVSNGRLHGVLAEIAPCNAVILFRARPLLHAFSSLPLPKFSSGADYN